jgi:hypothetical protein
MSELRKKVLDEIDALSKKDDISENLEKNLYNLYDYINDKNNLKDDRDIRIFLYANRDHAAVKPFSKDANYTAINQIITGKEPNLIKEDIKLKDIFGDTYLEPGVLDKMKGEHFKKLTDANKADFYEVLKAAEDEAVRKDREDIFFGTNFLQQLFTPRTYERRLRGEDDTYKDLGLDVIENAAYTFLPGSALKYLAKIPQAIPTVLAKGANALINAGAKGAKSDKVAKAANIANTAIDKGAKGVNKGIGVVIDNPVTNFGAGAVTNPFMMEGLDALSYDDNESTDRKDFSVTDALIGSGMNIGAPIAFKSAPGLVGRMLGGAKRGPKISRMVVQLGEGKSISDISNEARELGKPLQSISLAEGSLKDGENIIKAATDEVKQAMVDLQLAKLSKNKPAIDKAEKKLELLKAKYKMSEQPLNEFAENLNTHVDKYGYNNEYNPDFLKRVNELEKMDKAFNDIQKVKKSPKAPKENPNFIDKTADLLLNNKPVAWAKYKAAKPILGTYKQKAELVDEVLKTTDLDAVSKYDARKELLAILEDVKFDSDKDAEGYLLTYVAGKYGDMAYGDRASSLPIVGEAIKKLNEWELSKQRQKVRDSFSKMLLPEVKPDTTKEAK